jgi:hypothetical protein
MGHPMCSPEGAHLSRRHGAQQRFWPRFSRGVQRALAEKLTGHSCSESFGAYTGARLCERNPPQSAEQAVEISYENTKAKRIV